MDIMGYIQALISAGTPTAYACLGILAFFALSILWEILHGLRRGFARQLSHTIFMLVAAVLAFLTVNTFLSTVLGNLSEMSMAEVLALAESAGTTISEDLKNLISAFDTETLKYLLALPLSTVVAPLLFALVFKERKSSDA